MSGEARAVLFDFGGVLTSSVIDGFCDFSEEATGDRRLVLDLVAHDADVSAALVQIETGTLDEEGFEQRLCAALAARGVEIAPAGLLRRMQSHLRRDAAMVELVAAVRSRGIAVGLVSNSLGRDTYAGYDLAAMFDAVVISAHEGVRKPSRGLYEIACDRLGVRPEQAIMVDDLEQNIVAARRLGMDGIVHREAATTRDALAALLALDPTDLTPSPVEVTP